VNKLRQGVLSCGLLFLLAIGVSVERSPAQTSLPDAKTSVSDGAHPWYEIKVDPENVDNLIVCGTKLDALLDAPIGFIYSSSDRGKSWRAVLEDKNSTWVTEQSCAFGPNHRAYFISEASKIIDGNPHHELGTSRLYVSTDAGQHWRETMKTRWADYSTSAVSSPPDKLFTFFNTIAGEPGRSWGSNVGLLVFSPDDSKLEGPFFDSAMQDVGYDGSFPSNATALKSGAVAALYYGTRAGPLGREEDLGVIRARRAPGLLLEHSVILHRLESECFHLNDSSLAYDPQHDRIFVVYVDGCKNTQIMLTSSDDEGRTWTASTVVADFKNPKREIANPALVVGPGDNNLGLLWEKGQGSGRWLFSYIRNQKLAEPATELSQGVRSNQVSDDSLLTWIYQPNERHGGNPDAPPERAITVSIVNMLNVVWRGSGLVTAGNKILAVWPSGNSEGMRLYLRSFSASDSSSEGAMATDSKDSDSDVTADTVMFYGGIEHFDSTTAELKVCLTLGNRGAKSMRVPIKLIVEDIKSSIGTISVLNATNGLPGVGAVWDISDSVTGDRIAPRAISNPFCLSFHLEIPAKDFSGLDANNLLVLKMRIVASDNERLDRGERLRK
jgi:hypothetical protein